jgi:hypothetical protein
MRWIHYSFADEELEEGCITLELNRKRPGRIRRCEGLVSAGPLPIEF